MPKPLTDKDGEVIRPLTLAEAKELRPIAEADAGMLEAIEAWRRSLERKGASVKAIDARIRGKTAETTMRRRPKLRDARSSGSADAERLAGKKSI